MIKIKHVIRKIEGLVVDVQVFIQEHLAIIKFLWELFKSRGDIKGVVNNFQSHIVDCSDVKDTVSILDKK